MSPLEQVLDTDIVSLFVVVLRSAVVYVVLLALLRLFGKRELGQMAPFDLVVLLVISNAVQNAMVGPDTSLNAGLLAAMTLLLINWLVDRFALRSPWLRPRTTGSPTLLVYEGTLMQAQLAREGVTEEELMQALREHGVDERQAVKAAVLEVDGTISVVPVTAPRSRTRRRIRARKPIG